MPKNPFFLCFENAVSVQDLQFLQQISAECYQLYPHAFLLVASTSPSSFQKTITERFYMQDHFLALVQRNQKIHFLHSRPDIPSSV